MAATAASLAGCPPRHTGGAVRHGRAAGPGRRRARRCRAAGADRRRGPGQSAIAPAGHAGDAALPALLQLMDARAARAVAGPSTEPTQEAPAHAPAKMPSLSVRPSWPILLPRLSWPAAVEPGRLRHLVAGPGPTARRPALDATRRRQRRIVSGPARPDSPTRATCCRPTPPPARCRKTTPSIPATNTPWPNSSTWRNRPIRAPASPGTRRATPRWPPAWSERLPAAAGRHRHDGLAPQQRLQQHRPGRLLQQQQHARHRGRALAAMAAVRLRRPAGACRPPNRRPSPATSP